MMTNHTELEICLCGRCANVSILHRSILSPAPIPSKSFRTAAVTAASGEDMTTVFVTVTVGSRSDSGKGADSNALDSTSLLSPATEK